MEYEQAARIITSQKDTTRAVKNFENYVRAATYYGFDRPRPQRDEEQKSHLLSAHVHLPYWRWLKNEKGKRVKGKPPVEMEPEERAKRAAQAKEEFEAKIKAQITLWHAGVPRDEVIALQRNYEQLWPDIRPRLRQTRKNTVAGKPTTQGAHYDWRQRRQKAKAPSGRELVGRVLIRNGLLPSLSSAKRPFA